eukprot:3469111-Amphidinium_carterae.2
MVEWRLSRQWTAESGLRAQNAVDRSGGGSGAESGGLSLTILREGCANVQKFAASIEALGDNVFAERSCKHLRRKRGHELKVFVIVASPTADGRRPWLVSSSKACEGKRGSQSGLLDDATMPADERPAVWWSPCCLRAGVQAMNRFSKDPEANSTDFSAQISEWMWFDSPMEMTSRAMIWAASSGTSSKSKGVSRTKGLGAPARQSAVEPPLKSSRVR